MAHHVLRRLLKKKRFILGSPIEGVDVDPSLTRLYLMNDAGNIYYSRVYGIDINDWPDSLMVLSEAGPMYISRVDGIDINDWPDTLSVLVEAGPMYTTKIDGLSVDDWPDSLNVLTTADSMYSERINGLSVDAWPETMRIMSDEGAIRFASIEGIDINSWPETLRIMLAEGMPKGDSLDGLSVKRFVDDLAISLNLGAARLASIDGLSIKRFVDTVAIAGEFDRAILAAADGISIKRFVGDISVFEDAGPFFGGTLRGPELGDPSDLRTVKGVDFFGLTLPPIEVGIQIKRFVNDLNILTDADKPNLPSSPNIALKTTVTDMLIAEQFDGMVGGVSRGPELGNPSPERIITMIGEAFFEILIDRYDAIEVRDNITDIPVADVSDPESTQVVYATSESADLLVAASANMDPTFFNYQRVYATSEPADLLFESQTESKGLILLDTLDGLNLDFSDKTIFVASDLGPLIPAVTGLGSYGLEVSLSYSIS